ncbi:iron ABC transporter permease [Bosea sp. 685]|uniref:FecCD family ABC transporter permease n=1 Tax=Bosea sp. 685 TaxID=3080057 RepID=UPI002892FF8B|nr:iron ABC transporter permease [Bosea sp. 685]WNJ93140.1 iron ABC transporter permease [Bosea sp. 685]
MSYDRGATLVMVALAVGLGLVMVAALCAGRLSLSPGTVLGIVLSRIVPVDPSWSELQERIVLLVRLPRVLLTAICGAALAAAGAAMQGVLRNPLVSPHILGVSSGASFGGAVAILLGLSGWFLIGSAFLAGSAALLLVGAIARVDGRSGTVTVVLTGVIVAALFSALVSLTQFVAEPDSSLPAIVFWLMGSFATASWRQFAAAAPVLALALMLVLGLRFRINVLSLGEDDARALGLPVERDRWLVFLAVALMEATVVAFAGVIGWVGLVVPHAARMVAGEDHRLLIPASALLGASYLVLVDTIARTAVAAEIPLGVLTAIVGAPVFALLLRQRQRRELAA